MPLYDYRCTDCAHEFEVLQGMNDEPLTNCPQCKQDSLKKQMSAPAFTFKGGGWYKDLYSSADAGGNKKASATPASETSSTTSTTSTTTPSSDSKPAKSGD